MRNEYLGKVIKFQHDSSKRLAMAQEKPEGSLLYEAHHPLPGIGLKLVLSRGSKVVEYALKSSYKAVKKIHVSYHKEI